MLRNDDDIDSDDDHTSLRIVEARSASGATVGFTGEPGAGITYDPAGRFVSLGAGEMTTDTVTYLVEDRHGARGTGTVLITITGANDAPVAAEDRASTAQSEAVTLLPLANDNDPDRTDHLRITAVDGKPIAVGSEVTLASGARVVLDADGRITYDPHGGFDRLAEGERAVDSFRYRIDDGHGAGADAVAMVTIAGRNDPPVAVADTAIANEDGAAVSIDVLANDRDIDSDGGSGNLRVVAARAASGAAVSFDAQAGAGVRYAITGQFEYLAQGETATDTITYTIEDRHGARASSTVAVIVNGANDAPVAQNDQGSTDEDATVTLPVLRNDVDPDRSDHLQITAVDGAPIAAGGRATLASGAAVVLDAGGNLVYDPNGRFDGLAAAERATDHFRYRITDGHGGFADATATVGIEGRNDAPITRSDVAAASEDGPAIVIDVLGNDDDVDSDDDRSSLRVVAAQAQSGAAVTVNGKPGAGITYNPAGRLDFLGEGETGTDTVTYVVEDRHGARSTGTVTVTITGANDAPVAASDTLMIDANTVLRLPGPSILANDRDPDATDTLAITAINGLAASVGKTIALPTGVLLTVNADGTLTYDPNGKFDGLTDFQRATDGFAYTVADAHGRSSSAEVNILIQGKNDPPTAEADRAVTDQNSAVRIPVLINDTDPDAGGNLRVLGIDVSGTKGTVRTNADGSLTYDPGSAFDALRPGETAIDTFKYVVDDFVGGRSTGTVNVSVTGVVHPQSAHQELIQSFEIAPLPNASWGFLGSVATGAHIDVARGSDLASFQPTHLNEMAVLNAAGSAASGIEQYLSDDVAIGGRPLVHLPNDPVGGCSPNSGAAAKTTLSLDSHDLVAGRITLSFDWDFLSGEDQAQLSNLNDFAVFTVSDGASAHVFKLADARQTAGVSEGWRTSVYDVTGDFALPGAGPLRLTIGFAVMNDETPDNPSHLLVDNVRLNRSLGVDYERMHADLGLTTFRQRPEAGDDAIATAGGSAISEDQVAMLSTGQLLANDKASAGVDASTLRVVGLGTEATLASVTLTSSGVSYDPRGHFDFLAEGQVGTDRFEYLVTDGNDGTSRAQVTVTVVGRNDAPVTRADAAAAEENGANVAIDVLANDSDPDSDDDRSTLHIVAASATSGAVVAFTGAAGAGLTYQPGSIGAFDYLGVGESTVDTVTYVLEDRHGARATGAVEVTIADRNDAPTAIADAGATDEDTPLTLAVLANDSDPDRHDHLALGSINGTVVIAGAQVTLTSGATVVVGADGTLHYDAGAGFAHLARGETATDWLAYTAVDGHGGVSETSVSISIAGRNDPPQAMSDAISTDASTRLAIAPSTLLANDSDPDTGDAIHFVGLDAGSAVGVVSFDGAHINYDPAGRFQGLGEGETAIDAFTYRIADHDGAIATGNVAVTVHGRNDPPAAFDDSGATDEDTPITLTVLSNDSDPDLHDRLTVTSITTSGTRGQVTLNADGSITYDPRGHFDGLNAGQTDHDSFTYTIADGHGSTAAATVSVDIAGRSDTERLVESFEAAIPSGNRSSSYVATTDQYQETDGARGLYQPTDGLSMARLEAIGTLAQPLESFLGLPSRSLPKDPVDSTIAANGSALKLKLSVEAGDQISFDWMFDARDFVSTPPDGKSDDDYAIFTVAKSGNAELFKLSEVRQTGDQGASGWRSSIYTATAAGELTIGFGVINDRVADSPREHNSFLLVDNVRLNRDFGTGYQIVNHQSDGHFETLVHHA